MLGRAQDSILATCAFWAMVEVADQLSDPPRRAVSSLRPSHLLACAARASSGLTATVSICTSHAAYVLSPGRVMANKCTLYWIVPAACVGALERRPERACSARKVSAKVVHSEQMNLRSEVYRCMSYCDVAVRRKHLQQCDERAKLFCLSLGFSTP